MHRTPQPLIAIAIFLAALAGFVDAIAWSSLGGFFASFMSGNTTRLGVGVAGGYWADASLAAALILSFVCGVIIASILAHRFAGRHQSVVLATMTVFLLIAAVLANYTSLPFALLLLAAAMGAENGVFQRDGEVTIGLSYMTGALVRFGQRLAGALMGVGGRWDWLPHLLLWSGFVSGVLAGARWYALFGLDALWIAAAGGAVLTVVMARLTRTLSPAPGKR